MKLVLEAAAAVRSEIVFTEDVFSLLPSRKAGGCMLLTDQTVQALYRGELERLGVPVYAVPAGEKSKSAETLFRLLENMRGLHRGSTLIAFGGGVVGDLGGLAAALYMRGIPCVQVPTTLLAQVDSSVGGKTAVDFCGVKNLIGAFKPAEKVYIDPRFLDTLPVEEIRCGLGEMVKNAALSAPLFDGLAAGDLFDLAYLKTLVPAHVAFKAKIVRRDPFDRGERKCLNLGHTTAHAVEGASGLAHGVCVLIGILAESALARRSQLPCDHGYLDALGELTRSVLGKTPPLPPAEEVSRLALLDKKNGEDVRLILPLAKGKYGEFSLSPEAYARELSEIWGDVCGSP